MITLDELNEIQHSSVRHEQCPKCGSSNNLAVWTYDEYNIETYHCYSPNCDYHLGLYDALKGKGEKIKMPYVMPKSTFLKKGIVNRGLTGNTLKKYSVVIGTEGETKGNLFLPYYDADGTLIACKFRTPDKQMFWEGETKQPPLFGTQTIKPSDRREIFITEGELDALAVHQMLGVPAVSIPTGAKGALASVKRSLKFLEEFSKIYVCFDNDEAGQEAAKQVMEILRADKAFLVQLNPEYKDACGYLQNQIKDPKFDAVEQFKESISYAKRKSIHTIYTKEERKEMLREAFLIKKKKRTIKTGIKPLDDSLYMLPEDITTLVASPSVGKSSVVRQIAANRVKAGKPTLLFVFEESATVTQEKVIKMMYEGLTPCTSESDLDSIVEASESLYISNITSSSNMRTVEETIEYAVRMFDVDLVIFDNVTAFVAPDGSDAMSALNKMYASFVDMGKRFKHHTLLVSHTRRTDDKDEGRVPTMTDCLHSGHIERLSHNIVGLGRKQGEDTMTVCIRKQRDNGNCPEFTLFYDKAKYSFTGCYDINDELNDNEPNKKEVQENKQETKHEVRVNEEKNSEERVTERTVQDESVRFKVRDTNQRGDGQVRQSRFRKNSQSSQTVRRTNSFKSKLQPRLPSNFTVREDSLCGSEGALKRNGQNETTKPSPFLEGKAYTRLYKGFPVIT